MFAPCAAINCLLILAATGEYGPAWAVAMSVPMASLPVGAVVTAAVSVWFPAEVAANRRQPRRRG